MDLMKDISRVAILRMWYGVSLECNLVAGVNTELGKGAVLSVVTVLGIQYVRN